MRTTLSLGNDVAAAVQRLLLHAVDEESPFHRRAKTWLTDQLNGQRRVGSYGIRWQPRRFDEELAQRAPVR